jgi:hypothetical protein
VTGRPILVGWDLHAIAETAEGVRLEGRARLRPGYPVDLVVASGAPAPRRASVESWSIVRLGSDGPTYQGFCRWQ